MAFWTFDTDAQGWNEAVLDFQWHATEGIFPGCMFAGDTTNPITFIEFEPVMAFVGDPVSCYVKVTAPNPTYVPAVDVTFRIQTDNTTITYLFDSEGVEGYDSGWIRVSGVIDTEGEVGSVSAGLPDTEEENFYCYIDNVYFLQSDEIEAGLTRSAGGVPGSILI